MPADNPPVPIKVPPSGAQAAIEALLHERIGLNSASIGSSCVLHAIHQRMASVGLADITRYYQVLRQSLPEFTELVETVTVPETWFFRTHQSFTALENIAKHKWLPAHANDVLHILSVPCSTGEEPYSIAMTLLDSGFQPAQFIVDAVDINTRNLANAKHGIYSRNSFRNQDLSFRDRHFKKSGSAYQLSDRVRHAVNFIQGNLLDPGFMPGDRHYDIVFCRNLLIYFDRPTQDRAIKVLDRLLAKNGVLFLGHAESALVLNSWFSSARYPMAFAFYRNSDERRAHERAGQEETGVPARVSRRAVPERRKPSGVLSPRAFPEVPDLPIATNATSAALADKLAEAFRCADQGHLVEAAALCESYIQDAGPNAQAYYLLGLVRDAAGNKIQADEYLRKALYLDPNHYEALVQLAVLAEQQSDLHGAQQLRQRAQRVRERLGQLHKEGP
ncbi:MAG: CheR family methyltransferase [Gammaproteobacteria bacterium]